MTRLTLLISENPWQALLFSYTFSTLLLIILLRRILLPHLPVFQPLRLQIQRAYLSAASLTFPNLPHRLPVQDDVRRARMVKKGVPAYLVPGFRELNEFSSLSSTQRKCVVLYAHGGGYARGEARMYLNYMERWVSESAKRGLDMVFFTVEYPLSTVECHPAQRTAFLQAYEYLLAQNISPRRIVFMGDSAGGGLCVLSGLHLARMGLPQPAATVLISPWMDMTLRSHTGGNGAVESDYFLMANISVPGLVKLFIGNRSANDPDINPFHKEVADIQKLSPQLILAGGAEFARADAELWAEMCHKAGLRLHLTLEYAQLHVYALGSKLTDPKVRRTTDKMIIDWILSCVEGEKMSDQVVPK